MTDTTTTTSQLIVNGVTFKLLKTHETSWEPSSPDLKINMNLRLDGCIVPSETEGGRICYSHITVLDNFIDEETRLELKNFLLVSASPKSISNGHQKKGKESDGVLPEELWERKTADMQGAAPTWGVKQHVLQQLASGYPPAIVEVQSRLVKMYPEFNIAHLPSDSIQGSPDSDDNDEGANLDDEENNDDDGTKKKKKRRRLDIAAEQQKQQASLDDDGGVDCSAFLANAAVQGDSFVYHVDADPTSFPPSPWIDAFGDYFNGEPGKPLLVSLLIYLDDEWPRDWAADTLFLDSDTDTGVFVRPKPGRAVLMDQDVIHRVSAPSASAGAQPRLSLVLKLAFIPKNKKQQCCIAKPEWGPPVRFGSAARVAAVMRQIAKEGQNN